MSDPTVTNAVPNLGSNAVSNAVSDTASSASPPVALPRFDLLDLQSTDDATSFRLPVTRQLSTPFGFLYGGSGIAASAEASERVSGRPLQWITTQFLGSPGPGDVVDIEVHVAVEGRVTTQTQVSGRVDGTLVFTSLCAHNVRPAGDEAAFAEMPTVPQPAECPEFAMPFDVVHDGSFFDHLERRMARGVVAGDAIGRPQIPPIGIWARLKAQPTGSAATQGFIADMGPLVVCAALGIAPGGTSLDNTIRVVDPRPSEWVLLEMTPDGFHRSVGHSTVRIWSDDGRLLGIAQQSAIIRTSHHESQA